MPKAELDRNALPKHVGIIMDGNGRWAKKRLLPRSAGHKAGVEVARKIMTYADELGVKFLTLYTFSTTLPSFFETWVFRPNEMGVVSVGFFSAA